MDERVRIGGAEQLTAIFGYWPSFHDAEVLWIKLDRQPYIVRYGPTLEALIHTHEMTSEVDSAGFYVLRNHVLVHMRFEGVDQLHLEGFNHQNALGELALTDLRDRQMEWIRWEVKFASSWGVGASFQCYSVEVVSVKPCNKDGEPIA